MSLKHLSNALEFLDSELEYATERQLFISGDLEERIILEDNLSWLDGQLDWGLRVTLHNLLSSRNQSFTSR